MLRGCAARVPAARLALGLVSNRPALLSFDNRLPSMRRNGKKPKGNMHRDGSDGKPQNRTAVLVRCSPDEAAAIRAAAIRERRTISGFILNATANRVRRYQLTVTQWSSPKLTATQPSSSKTNGQSQRESAAYFQSRSTPTATRGYQCSQPTYPAS